MTSEQFIKIRNLIENEFSHAVTKHTKIRIGTGKPEWGAEYGKLYFVISWDKEIKQ